MCTSTMICNESWKKLQGSWLMPLAQQKKCHRGRPSNRLFATIHSWLQRLQRRAETTGIHYLCPASESHDLCRQQEEFRTSFVTLNHQPINGAPFPHSKPYRRTLLHGDTRDGHVGGSSQGVSAGASGREAGKRRRTVCARRMYRQENHCRCGPFRW